MKTRLLRSRWPSLAAGRAHAPGAGPHLALRQRTTPTTQSEAQAHGCKLMEGGNVTVVQGTQGATAMPCAWPPARRRRRRAAPRVEPADQKARDADARAILEAELKKAEARQAELAQGIQQRRAREAGPRGAQLPEVPRPRRGTEGQHRPQRERHRRHPARTRPRMPARTRQSVIAMAFGTAAAAPRRALPVLRPARHAGGGGPPRRHRPVRQCRPRGRAGHLAPHASKAPAFRACFTEPHVLRTALDGARQQRVRRAALRRLAASRQNARADAGARGAWRRPTQPGEIVVELLPLEQQARQDREERLIDQAQANKELIRNLAHEIKNPLGGIRGAAQLLRDGDRVARPEGVHAGHHPRGRPAADAGRPPAGAAPPAARGGRRQHPRGLRARALADPGGVPARPARRARLRHVAFPSSAATASS